MAILVPAFLLAGSVAAQDKKAEKKAPVRAAKVLLDNDKVRVTESVFKPGEENPMEPRGYRIGRVLKGSTTIERRHKDGKVEKIEWKEGQVYQSGPDNASAKNIGKGEVVLYTVTLKQAK
ncbi:MAG TPA: hypothetical protein VM183_14590 [Burkholderiales bacterium]|nr:hypothetical protein [Burkholderiales bacterium]